MARILEIVNQLSIIINGLSYRSWQKELLRMESLNAIVRFIECVGDNEGQVPDNRKKSGVEKKKKRPKISITDSDESLIDNLFPSGIRGDFIGKHFKKHPLVTRGSKECLEYLKSQLHEFDLESLLQESASERIHVWLSQQGSQSLDSISLEDQSHALKLYAAGHSIYCRGAQELESVVIPHLLNDLGLGAIGSCNDKYRRGEIELFMSRKGHTTGAIISTVKWQLFQAMLMLNEPHRTISFHVHQTSIQIFRKISPFNCMVRRNGPLGRAQQLRL